jgi:peptidoglycan hydrolase-like protein with peptidoglycan-binding domain
MNSTIKRGDRGEEVKSWQRFLVDSGYDIEKIDGIFGKITEEKTKKIQIRHGITPDGIVGTDSWNLMFRSNTKLRPMGSNSERERSFGKFSYTPNPIPGNPENIRMDPVWCRENIRQVSIPQLMGIKGAPKSGIIQFHKLGSENIKKFFQSVEDNNLLEKIISWDGSFVPRFIRGSSTYLSNHSWATAFDINARWNPLGSSGAKRGSTGSVHEILEIAEENGFYWGGNFRGRPDPMHFELAYPLL